ncbi:MAG: ABC transporter permease [Asticcacaulis sp.]|uniref:ABC transporter permease n=1 Tax=Asticcacaulis sp. TaxID=1872648 RepID=UPI0039E2AEFF
MFKSAGIAFLRSFTRHPLYALLNLLGLSLGIAVFITMGQFVRYEMGYDSFWRGAADIQAITTTWTFPNRPAQKDFSTMGGLLDQLHEDYPQLIGTRLHGSGAIVHSGDTLSEEYAVQVDPDFFKVFDLDLIAGDKTVALRDPQSVMLSESLAKKYFPDRPAFGQTLILSDELGTSPYRVTAVFRDVSEQSSERFRLIRPLTKARMLSGNWYHWGSENLTTYLRLKPAEARNLKASMPGFVDRKGGHAFGDNVPHKVVQIGFQPMTSIHLDDAKSRTAVIILGVVGSLAFLIAAINYINLATARAGMRAREVAVRKTLGATRTGLIGQFLFEAVCNMLLAVLIGFSLVELTLPVMNAVGGLSLKLDYAHDWPALAAIVGGLALTGCLAGIYPALVLSGFRPALVLATSRTPAGGRLGARVREGLVVVQFAVVVAFFVLVTGFYSQIAHMKTADIGFRREGLLITRVTTDPNVTPAQVDAYVTALSRMPQVAGVTFANAAPGDDSESNAENLTPEGYNGNSPPHSSWTITGPDFFKTYGTRLLAGRVLDLNHGEDQRSSLEAIKTAPPETPIPLSNIVLSRGATKLMNYASPQAALGKILTLGYDKVRVIGVVEDMRLQSPNEKVPPMVYIFDAHPTHNPIVTLRFADVPEPLMRDRMAAAWKQVAPNVPFQVVSAEENLDKYYKPERNRSNLLGIGALIAAVIGSIGLYGMAAFNTSRRALEIGLRKTLGASRGQVVRLLAFQFLRPVLIANLIAWPVAWWVLKNWLSQFDDAVALNPFQFLAPSLAALLIAALTVTGLAFATAGKAPGKALRHD